MRSLSDISRLIESDPWRMEILRIVKQLNLRDWAIGAGFVRAAVWDALSGKKERTLIGDIDVIYFDKSDTSPITDRALEVELKAMRQGIPWSVKNQARMHKRNDDKPYLSTENALSFWLETPTCIAVRLRPNDTVKVLAPHGIEDLMGMQVRPTQRGKQKIDQYRQRVQSKNWQEDWPTLTIEGLED